MSLHIPFENSYVDLPDRLFARQKPTPVRAPKLIAYNAPLGAELGITEDTDEAELAQVFSGTQLPEGSDPIAQLYAGHQFGNWNPQLGDGRAVLLGESKGYDIQLKGSGKTPFSRRGDGRSWLGPVLREYIVSEAMHAFGVPTTRALAAVETGETVFRERPQPGGILTRVASSHIRVGTFQVLTARQDIEGLQSIMSYSCARHYPEASSPAEFLASVIARQAALVAHWMALGFIHGVMNTDNCSISGETIDYGPCAFMDAFHPGKVFSSIDHYGRYAYGNQPEIAAWNMAQLATALLPLESNSDAAVQEFTKLVHAMPEMIRTGWRNRFAAKLGITEVVAEDEDLIADLLEIMTDTKVDFTNSFSALTDGTATESPLGAIDTFQDWHSRWQRRLEAETTDPKATMAAANPVRIPRNHRIEALIQAALQGDYAPFHRLHAALAQPYDVIEEFADLTAPPEPGEVVTHTFCGT
ncbi:protein adenylyltransferase SelO [Shimia sp. R9_3]|uniref:protein adenylyltransferase SelO n=1 Tax=Shimia sp. R9_3 TaxID=2821113 RepID=UPI001ADA52FF|nr:YdiU family protein [Shimia sp. R9_3]MBO9401442.1 YdiU family protein [Shimia sp. R9_3]